MGVDKEGHALVCCTDRTAVREGALGSCLRLVEGAHWDHTRHSSNSIADHHDVVRS